MRKPKGVICSNPSSITYSMKKLARLTSDLTFKPDPLPAQPFARGSSRKRTLQPRLPSLGVTERLNECIQKDPS